jgi:hypothetical protein
MEIKKPQGIHKSKGGLIRSFVTTENGRIKEISISGDFFLFPEEAFFNIAKELKGIIAKREEVEQKIIEIYRRENIQSPGTTPADFTESIMKALEG